MANNSGDLEQSLVGMEGSVFIVEVERGQIKRFAEAIGDPNPLFSDQEAAAKTPYGGIIAPPTFAITFGADGSGALQLELDYRRMLHGGQEFIFFRPIRVGERLYCQSKVVDLYEREGKGGGMQFLVIDTEAKDAEGNHIVTSRNTIVYRKLA